MILNRNKITILALLLIILALIMFFMGKSSSNDTNNLNSIINFSHRPPAEKFNFLVKDFGNPDVFVNKPNGIAIWFKKDIFENIMLLDESVEHQSPTPHCDFLYTTIMIHIPEEILCKVLELSDSIYYDKLKKHLTVRCNSMQSNVLMLYLAMRIINDRSNMETYKNMYPNLINLNPENYVKIYEILKTMILENQKLNIKRSPNMNCMSNN